MQQDRAGASSRRRHRNHSHEYALRGRSPHHDAQDPQPQLPRHGADSTAVSGERAGHSKLGTLQRSFLSSLCMHLF